MYLFKGQKVKGQLVSDVLNSQHAGTGATWRINAKILSTCRVRRHIVSPRAQLFLGAVSNSLWQSLLTETVLQHFRYWTMTTVVLLVSEISMCAVTALYLFHFCSTPQYDKDSFWMCLRLVNYSHGLGLGSSSVHHITAWVRKYTSNVPGQFRRLQWRLNSEHVLNSCILFQNIF